MPEEPEDNDQNIPSEPVEDELYDWIISIPLSRPQRNLARDFADGVMFAEAVAFLMPKLVELHNYHAANSTKQKIANWNTLNRKVLSKLGWELTTAMIQDLAEAKPGAIEPVLRRLREISQNQEQPQPQTDDPDTENEEDEYEAESPTRQHQDSSERNSLEIDDQLAMDQEIQSLRKETDLLKNKFDILADLATKKAARIEELTFQLHEIQLAYEALVSSMNRTEPG